MEDVPEEFDGVLDCASLAICCSFNRRGSLMAVGCNDGKIVIWDFLTRGIAKYIAAHDKHPICSISWSRDGHRLVSCSLDNTIAIWHVLSSVCLMRCKFPSPILKSQFNPRNDRLILVCPVKYAPILIEVDYEQGSVIQRILPIDNDDPDLNIVASFDRRGQFIYTGNAKGRLAIIKCPKTLTRIDDNTNIEEPIIVSSFRVQTPSSMPAAIKEIEFGPRNKTNFLVNSSDKTIRLYDCNSALRAGVNGACDDVGKFQDLVNRTMWRRCCFSGGKNASYVCGGSARQHALYIWDTENGVSPKKVLRGTKGELLLDIQWHPTRPVVASISSGLISIWARPQIENWSAFAPHFRELEENIEYDERESEFDEEDEDNHLNVNQEANSDVVDEVDVTQVEMNRDLMSSDEEEIDHNSLENIPITLEDHSMATSESAPPDTGNHFVQPNSDELKEAKKTIEIVLTNPPVDEIHPLTLATTKRVRVTDKLGIPKKAIRVQSL